MPTREQLERQLATTIAQLERLDTFPAQDPYKDGQALQLKWKSPTNGRTYNYVAVRAGGNWYTTGREAMYARPWPVFVEWLVRGQVDRLEVLVQKSKYDRKLQKARAAAQIAATQFNAQTSRSVSVHVPDAVEVKDLFEDMVTLRAVVRPGIINVISTPIIDRILQYAKATLTNPGGEEAAVFLAALARYESGMAATDARDAG